MRLANLLADRDDHALPTDSCADPQRERDRHDHPGYYEINHAAHLRTQMLKRLFVRRRQECGLSVLELSQSVVRAQEAIAQVNARLRRQAVQSGGVAQDIPNLR